MRPADKAWATMATGIFLYEAFAKDDELLSEGWDRYMKSHPVIAFAGPFLVAGHLTNTLPPWADPIHQSFLLLGHVAKKLSTFIHRHS
ncbi:hypothetical protein SEA_LILIZI_110 [Mycobacterium phage Lilizi]|nr:hypothetical protein SEA_LILIZI_110 [Mycobacterium phage Lilizi]